MTDTGDDKEALLPAWQQLSGALRAFFARRVPAADVDDLLQDCYLKVSQGLPALQDQERLGAWIFRIARNLAVDHLRRRQRDLQREEAEEAAETPSHNTEEPDPHLRVAGWLAPFVERLPEKYADVMRLSELEELPHSEIAARLDLSISGVKSRVQRGRALLRDKLLACCSFEFDRRGRILDHRRNAPGSCGCQ